MWAWQGSNLRPTDYESAALTPELQARFFKETSHFHNAQCSCKVTSLQIFMKIRNIIFDLGGVIIDIDPRQSLEAFAKHSNALADSAFRNELFFEFETGRIDAAAFRRKVKEAWKVDISDVLIDECMNIMLGEIPQERLDLLKKIKQKYNSILISNTNSIHYDSICVYLTEKFNINSFDDFFHKTYYSHIVGLRKPDPKIFELALKENNFLPEETLYLDDTGEHLKSARSLGIQTVKVTPENSVLEILKDF